MHPNNLTMTHYPQRFTDELKSLTQQIDDTKLHLRHLTELFVRVKARGLVNHDVELHGHLMYMSAERWEEIQGIPPNHKFSAWDEGQQEGNAWVYHYSFGSLVIDVASDNEEGIVVGETQYFVYVLQRGDEEDGMMIKKLHKQGITITTKYDKLFWED